ncbi:hypothetical protein [Curvibacter gracilis]|uniref:hypothetical protein n=1 Tax=Curvibacter gracilis TaxID=230310 RepID=UPI0012FA47C2|nr:hypothetical protein [Curvibacter gracilis]
MAETEKETETEKKLPSSNESDLNVDFIDDAYPINNYNKIAGLRIKQKISHAIKFKNELSKIRNNFFPIFAIVIAVIAFFVIEKIGINSYLGKIEINHKWAIAGTLLLLTGTFWAALGGYLDPKEEAKLRKKAEKKELEMSELVNLMIINSKFLSQGAMLAFWGSILLLIDLIFY